ncbi:hypothetical protein [Kutzneria chonburiensis]|uniref:Uncharacterized protein n=1 Tax=Kutzneria chonburiensis TaxID=1483604 RepID=A0ABV6N302_9PSEU|nr:hypothetical protein [Kutzneria chonburiensis]
METPFAEPSALVAYLGSTLSLDRAAMLLAHASDIIRGVARQQLHLVEDDTVTLDPLGQVVLLPELPVLAVSSVDVLVNGMWSPFAGRWVWSATGTVRAVPSHWWPTTPRSVRVTYDHGYDPIPSDLATVCVSLAARLAVNPVHLQQQTVGGVQVRFAPSAAGEGGVLDDVEQAIVDRYSVAGVA